jgi:cell cycle arrest protein BUB3
MSFEDKVYDICQSKDKLAISVGSNNVLLFDKRNFKEPIKNIKLNSSVRCISNYKDKALLIGSVEGKITVESYNAGEEYSFKCHRVESEEEVMVYPVNCLEPCPFNDNFLSGGADCYVHFWDYLKRKKIKRSKEYSQSINHCKFSKDGSMLALSLGNVYEESEETK